MHIARRTSGGRGEYEISGGFEGGLQAKDLLGRVICLDVGGGLLINSALVLKSQGGKLRLRRAGAEMQVQRQLVAALLMPESVRADAALGAAAPVIQSNRYAVAEIVVKNALLIPPDLAVLTLGKMELRNHSHFADEISIPDRVKELLEVWKRRNEFPDEISALLGEHQVVLKSGGPIILSAEAGVAKLQRLTADNSADLGIVYSANGDVLPKLVESLRMQTPAPPLLIQDLDQEDWASKKRVAKEWKRWANARGPTSARFRREVRKAYNATCIVCGSHYPPTPYSVSGVDAAHILPWSEYDLDEVFNGLCLCKLHHWAFDEGLIRLFHDGSDYVSEMAEDAAENLPIIAPQFSIEILRQPLGVIPLERLPSNPKEWPRPSLLETLSNLE